MRKLILFNMVTLDGFFAGPNGEIDWHRVDDEFNEFAIAQLNNAGCLIFGRITYQLMAQYWPTAMALQDDPIVANLMNTIPKIAVSRSLQTADWNNTRLITTNLVAEMMALKQQPGRDLFVFGSANLASTLIHSGLIDEYRLIVNPVILGSGIPLFHGNDQPLQLNLLNVKPFRNGNVLLTYGLVATNQ
jgi:dihydrofolate reductase